MQGVTKCKKNTITRLLTWWIQARSATLNNWWLGGWGCLACKASWPGSLSCLWLTNTSAKLKDMSPYERRAQSVWIAKLLDRNKSTISWELSHNTGSRGYRPKQVCEMPASAKQPQLRYGASLGDWPSAVAAAIAMKTRSNFLKIAHQEPRLS